MMWCWCHQMGFVCPVPNPTVQLAGNVDADLMIAGGTEAAIIPIRVGGFVACGALSQRNDDPTQNAFDEVLMKGRNTEDEAMPHKQLSRDVLHNLCSDCQIAREPPQILFIFAPHHMFIFISVLGWLML
ncbi:unnamed protein product [Fraxinus pennsylvanica]|uniref:beta-ketoacyl-[acyl-carrier-protein] synthase I n=1 Tax=Fraxinus pennsylvanica TaxID=56036 RepID=A0AAD1ZX00_9LAMI|nr:unnamed protein product [Fraxinus pennsylvanica]